jgi:hypothetical protein
MSLFPYEDVLTKEIEAWSGFADKLLYHRYSSESESIICC